MECSIKEVKHAFTAALRIADWKPSTRERFTSHEVADLLQIGETFCEILTLLKDVMSHIRNFKIVFSLRHFLENDTLLEIFHTFAVMLNLHHQSSVNRQKQMKFQIILRSTVAYRSQP